MQIDAQHPVTYRNCKHLIFSVQWDVHAYAGKRISLVSLSIYIYIYCSWLLCKMPVATYWIDFAFGYSTYTNSLIRKETETLSHESTSNSLAHGVSLSIYLALSLFAISCAYSLLLFSLLTFVHPKHIIHVKIHVFGENSHTRTHKNRPRAHTIYFMHSVHLENEYEYIHFDGGQRSRFYTLKMPKKKKQTLLQTTKTTITTTTIQPNNKKHTESLHCSLSKRIFISIDTK